MMDMQRGVKVEESMPSAVGAAGRARWQDWTSGVVATEHALLGDHGIRGRLARHGPRIYEIAV